MTKRHDEEDEDEELTIADGRGGAARCSAAAHRRPGDEPARVLNVSMTGIQEVPGPGDPDGNGTAEVRVDARRRARSAGTSMRAASTPATAAHIHRGAAGVAGPPVVTLTTPDAAGRSQGCAAVDPSWRARWRLRSHEFYVNVHNAAAPGRRDPRPAQGAASDPGAAPGRTG